MSKRPVRDATPLSDAERPLVDDLIAVMELALARRRKLVHKPRTVPRFYVDTGRAESVVVYQNLDGDDPITAEEYERTRDEREEALRALERALLPLAKAAFEPGRNKPRAGARLVEMFRPDQHPKGPLAVGAFAANSGKGWIESRDDCWERVVTWCERLRDGTHDRAVAARVIHCVLGVLKDTYNAFAGPVPSAEQLMDAFTPATGTTKQARGRNSIAAMICELVDDISKDAILLAIERSDEQANREYVFDADGRPTTHRLRPRNEWVGRTIQQEQLRFMFYPMRFASWDGSPEPQVPAEWKDDTNSERMRRFQNAKWEGSTLLPLDQGANPERGAPPADADNRGVVSASSTQREG